MSTSKEIRYNDFKIDFKYLLVNERDRLYGLTVNTVGFQPIRAHTEYPSAKHPQSYFFNPERGRILSEYQILYISKGEGTFTSETTKKTKITKGQIIFLFPGQWHTYKPNIEKGWNEYYIGFEGSHVDNMLKNNFISPESQLLNVGVSEELVQLFTMALKVAKEDNKFTQQFLAGIVMNILGMVMCVSQNRAFQSNKSGEVIERAKIIMIENLHKDADIKKIASKLSVSYSWFRKVFKEYTGFSPNQYFLELKLRRAKELLAESNFSIKEISYDLNFSSYEYFLSFFKNRVGMTPLEYRNLGRV